MPFDHFDAFWKQFEQAVVVGGDVALHRASVSLLQLLQLQDSFEERAEGWVQCDQFKPLFSNTQLSIQPTREA
jgi:hypothetical protein